MLQTKFDYYYVYLIRCSNGSYYTGIAKNPKKRFRQHKSGKGGKYFRIVNPLEMVIVETVRDRSQAQMVEARIKKQTKEEKKLLFLSYQIDLVNLSSPEDVSHKETMCKPLNGIESGKDYKNLL